MRHKIERDKPCTLKDYASVKAYTERVPLTNNPDTSTPVTSSYFAQNDLHSDLPYGMVGMVW